VWLEKTLADEWVANNDGQVVKKAQSLAELKSGAYKVESLSLSDMKALVLGETAVVLGVATEKSSNKGKDTSGQYRWTDVFKKRDGRWQCVSSHNNKVT
jgi:ketosteroid isomerase-like protein